MSLSEQFATTPRPRESRLIAAAADLLRAAGWRVEAPVTVPEVDPWQPVGEGPPGWAWCPLRQAWHDPTPTPALRALMSDTSARQDRYVAQWLQRPEFVAALRRRGAELVPDAGGNWRMQWRPDGVGEALPCDCEPPA